MPEIVFMQSDRRTARVQVDSGRSLMRGAVENDIAGILGECGGSMTCGTCHVHIDEAWQALTGPPSENEQLMLDFVADFRPVSRLSCQIQVDDTLDGLVVHVPASVD